MKKIDKLKINLRAIPYKGVLKEIAREQGTSQQAIWNAVYTYQNPRIITILTDKIKERKKAYRISKTRLQAEFANN